MLSPYKSNVLFSRELGMNTENTDSQRLNKIIAEIQALQEVVTRFRQLRLDATEFACLKCIVTFKAGGVRGNIIKYNILKRNIAIINNYRNFLYWPNSSSEQTCCFFPRPCSSNTQWFGIEELSQRQCHRSPSGRSPADSKQLHPHQVQHGWIYKSSLVFRKFKTLHFVCVCFFF